MLVLIVHLAFHVVTDGYHVRINGRLSGLSFSKNENTKLRREEGLGEDLFLY